MPFDVLQKEDALLVIQLSGEIDLFEARDLKPSLNQLAEEAARDVIVDLTRAAYLDSSALGLLVGLRKRVLAHGRRLVVAVEGPSVRKLFALSDLDQLFTLVEGMDEARRQAGAAP